jgi:hypothetical protein
MKHAVRGVLIIPCVAVVFGFAAFGGVSAQAQSTNAAGAEFDGLCRQRGGVPSGNQCLIAPSAPAPAPSAPRSSGGGGQNFNRAMGNFNNALGALGAEQEQEEQDRENAAEQQRQDQAARDAAEAQRRAAEAAADAQRRAGLSNPFSGAQPANTSGNPFAASAGQPVASNNPFAAQADTRPYLDSWQHPPLENWNERPPRGNYYMTKADCVRWGGYFTSDPNTPRYTGDGNNLPPLTGQCVIRTVARQPDYKPSGDLGVRN